MSSIAHVIVLFNLTMIIMMMTIRLSLLRKKFLMQLEYVQFEEAFIDDNTVLFD